ncbi:MAG TPA: FAD:protein FMN transferase [Thermoanaerobaculia bacterium]|nr:FAD:protein FMN transferase [Thermoanaerobaculia bacterium]
MRGFAPVLLISVAAAAGLAAGAAEPGAAAEPVRLSSRLLGEPAILEVHDLAPEAGEAALRAAFAGLEELEALLAAAVERLNAGAEAERTVAVEPAVAELLVRALEFCDWSRGAHGPLGGGLAAYWRALAGNPSPPPPPAALTESATCDRLRVDPEAGTARIAGGSRVDLAGFAAGAAVDRAVAALVEQGAGNGRVRIGRVERAFGAGPDGEGWLAALPVFEGFERPLDQFYLRDRSLALVSRADWEADVPRHLDQRTGLPPDGVWATVAVTERALDAQALAVAALVLGAREGRFRSATIEPRPSVLWLLGRGTGRPLLMELNWAALRAPRP